MNNGIVGEWRQNKKGVWYTSIKDASAGFEAHYPLSDEKEEKLAEGTRVTFGTRSNNNGAGKPLAYNVRISNQRDPQPRKPIVSSQQPVGDICAEYYLPTDTANLLRTSPKMMIDSTALKTQKYIQVFHEREKKLKVISEQAYSNAERDLLKSVNQTQRAALSAFEDTYSVTGVLGSRMMVGLGGGSVFETAITLHHTYGFPHIPGSTLKGCLRSFIIREKFCGVEDAAIACDTFAAVFGTQARRGSILFLDAFPVKCDKLELDIMNPHYPDYYQGKRAPTDDMDPNPIKFYAVPEGTQFVFRLANNPPDKTRPAPMLRDIEIKETPLTELLITTLSDIGIGAKTAVGYGWFGKVEEVVV